jgi:predicted nuclease with TOPRIM domain
VYSLPDDFDHIGQKVNEVEEKIKHLEVKSTMVHDYLHKINSKIEELVQFKKEYEKNS